MELILKITVDGKPVPWARTRGAGSRRFIAPEPENWKHVIGYYARNVMKSRDPFAGCVRLEMRAFFPVSKSWYEWKKALALAGGLRPTGTPDLDNLEKNVLDAFNTIVWNDDAQVVEVVKGKYYDSKPRVEIEVYALDEHPTNISRKPEGE